MKYLIVLVGLLIITSCGNRKEATQEVEAIEQEIVQAEEAIEEVAEEVTEEVEEVAEAVEEVVEDADYNFENSRVVGIVHVSETDCPFYIETKLEDKTVNMYPINLKDQYKREGMKLKFVYALSRAPQPTNCDVAMVVSVSDVSIMR